MATGPSQIKPYFGTTTPIIYEDVSGGATGFFLKEDDDVYLITNQHVVDPDDADPSKAKIWYRPDPNNVRHTRDIAISLEESEWYGHPTKEVDVAAVPLDIEIDALDQAGDGDTTSGSLAFTPDHFIPDAIQIDYRVIILGYPRLFMDRSTLFPVKRQALVASPYGINFDGKPYFVTDARTHSGLSGSPVIFEPGGFLRSSGSIPDGRNKEIFLLGVHSASFRGSFNEDNNQQNSLLAKYQNQATESPLNLNVEWYPHLITEILSQI